MADKNPSRSVRKRDNWRFIDDDRDRYTAAALNKLEIAVLPFWGIVAAVCVTFNIWAFFGALAVGVACWIFIRLVRVKLRGGWQLVGQRVKGYVSLWPISLGCAALFLVIAAGLFLEPKIRPTSLTSRSIVNFIDATENWWVGHQTVVINGKNDRLVGSTSSEHQPPNPNQTSLPCSDLECQFLAYEGDQSYWIAADSHADSCNNVECGLFETRFQQWNAKVVVSDSLQEGKRSRRQRPSQLVETYRKQRQPRPVSPFAYVSRDSRQSHQTPTSVENPLTNYNFRARNAGDYAEDLIGNN